jgi:hypothetical protein
MTKPYLNPEPVPPATQLALLPFIAAVDGFLRQEYKTPELKITVHRAISRQKKGYLQQVCAYLNDKGADGRGVGRIFPVDEGVIGAAFGNQRIWRTKAYNNDADFENDLRQSMPASGDNRTPADVEWSYLAIPFLGPQDQVVLILYGACAQLNFFADDARLVHVVAMCKGFCRMFDWLQ